jgi:hypothetical protein
MTFTADDNPAQVAQKVRIVSDLSDGKYAECIVSGSITH